MPRSCLCLMSLLLTLALPASPARAQDWSQPWADPQDRPPRVDISASAGFVMPTSWSDLVLLGSISPVSGVVEQVLTREMRVEPDNELSGAATYWRGRYGFRTHAGFSRSSLSIGGSPGVGAPAALTSASSIAALANAGTSSVGVDTWMYDVGGAIGFLDYAPTRWVWPYGFIGLGGITYDLKQRVAPPLTIVEGGAAGPLAGADTVIVADRSRPFLLAVDELGMESVFALNFGVGTDFRIPIGPAGVGLRLEVSDHLAPSPVGLRIRELSRHGAFASDSGIAFRGVHHLSATVGVMVRIGR
jgi:hypothetical protein